MSQVFVRAASDEVGLRRESRVEETGLPLWLARLHRSLPADTQVRIHLKREASDNGSVRIADLIEGAGFTGHGPTYTRLQSIPDTVSLSLRVLVVGLNPGFASAEAGIPFANPTNRFWSVSQNAGLVTVDRDADRALSVDRVGFTDLVKRTTRTAAELSASEFAAGLQRLQRMARWASPDLVLVVGLGGWRSAVDRQASSGWQDTSVLGTNTYLMPSTSGLNAHATADHLQSHIEAAMAGPDRDSSSDLIPS